MTRRFSRSCTILFLAALAALGQSAVSINDRYQTVQSGRMTADERIALYEKQLKDEPGNPATQTSLASAFIQKLRETANFLYLDRAAAVVDRLLTTDPKSYEAIRLSAEIATHRHNFPLAVQYATELTERNPSDAGAFGMLGDCLMELGRYDDAGNAYSRMLMLSPNLASYNRIAYHRFVTGREPEALAWMSMAVEAGSATPENLAWCLVELGDLLIKAGKTEQAVESYRRALQNLPNYHRAHAALGRALAAAGEYQKAVDHFRLAQAVIPLPEYAASLERLYDRLGENSKAQKQRELLDVIDKLGHVNGEKGNRALALAYADENRNLNRALELARGELDVREDVYTYDALSWVLYRSGKQAEAEEASERALKRHTPEPMFLYHAGVIAISGKREEEGRKLLQRALALNANFAFPQADDARRLLEKPSRH